MDLDEEEEDLAAETEQNEEEVDDEEEEVCAFRTTATICLYDKKLIVFFIFWIFYSERIALVAYSYVNLYKFLVI